MSGITVTREGDELVAVKRSDVVDAAAIRAEAAVLQRIDHPGVVALLSFADGDTPELRTRYVGTETWARTVPPTDTAAQRGLAVVAATVADLHDLGIGHGALTPEHVIVAPDGRPVLCGLGRAPRCDAAAELADLLAFADLVRAVTDHLGPAATQPFDELVAEITAGQTTMRGAAETLASRERDAAEAAPIRPRRRVIGALAGLALTAAIALLVLGRADEPDPGDSVVAARSDHVAPTAASVPTAPPPTSRAALPPSTTTPSTTAAVAPFSDNEFVHGGRRYGLGTGADITVIGDWNCDGIATPALLQPAHGLVAVFESWPEPGGSIPPAATAPAPDATGLERVDDEECDRLRIIEPTGSRFFTPET